MLVVAGHLRIDASRRKDAIAASRAAMQATRQEPGCISYAFSADLEDESLFHVFEEWEDQAALDAHFQRPHMAEFSKSIATLGVREMHIQRYAVSRVGPLRD
jgi:quinol monooxygenase YgiN